jgi:hypothetical protein
MTCIFLLSRLHRSYLPLVPLRPHPLHFLLPRKTNLALSRRQTARTTHHHMPPPLIPLLRFVHQIILQFLQSPKSVTDLVFLLAVHFCIRLASPFFRCENWVPTEMSRTARWNNVSFSVTFEEQRFGTWSCRVCERADGSSAGGVEAL